MTVTLARPFLLTALTALAALPLQAQQVREVLVEELIGAPVTAADDERLGNVDRVIRQDDDMYLVVASGGILGLGRSETAVPAEKAALAETEVKLPELDSKAVESLPDIDHGKEQRVAMDRILDLRTSD